MSGFNIEKRKRGMIEEWRKTRWVWEAECGRISRKIVEKNMNDGMPVLKTKKKIRIIDNFVYYRTGTHMMNAVEVTEQGKIQQREKIKRKKVNTWVQWDLRDY